MAVRQLHCETRRAYSDGVVKRETSSVARSALGQVEEGVNTHAREGGRGEEADMEGTVSLLGTSVWGIHIPLHVVVEASEERGVDDELRAIVEVNDVRGKASGSGSHGRVDPGRGSRGGAVGGGGGPRSVRSRVHPRRCGGSIPRHVSSPIRSTVGSCGGIPRHVSCAVGGDVGSCGVPTRLSQSKSCDKNKKRD